MILFTALLAQTAQIVKLIQIWFIEQLNIILALKQLLILIQKMTNDIEKEYLVKIVFCNALNVLYSKKNDKYYIGNLQNTVFVENSKVGKDKDQNERIQSANIFYKAIFPS